MVELAVPRIVHSAMGACNMDVAVVDKAYSTMAKEASMRLAPCAEAVVRIASCSDGRDTGLVAEAVSTADDSNANQVIAVVTVAFAVATADVRKVRYQRDWQYFDSSYG